MKKVLIDTGFLFALNYERDDKHIEALEAAKLIVGERIVVAPVLAELFWNLIGDKIHLNERARYRQAINILGRVQAEFPIEQLTPEDRSRMLEIMQQYADSRFDYVDVALMAVSERLNIRTICTFDKRDFPHFVPKHGYFTILP